MALTKMIVSDGQGNSIKVAKFPYQFYAKADTNVDGKPGLAPVPVIFVINILMPMGGKESGLFRYPKAGEQVIVDQDSDNNYYLMGYLPSETDPTNNFLTNVDGENKAEKQALENEKGIILRYEQTGLKNPPAYDPKDTSELYSEIGFYHRPTQWKAKTKGDYNDFDTNNTDIPLIDQLNIQSSGDIHTKAVNHHRMKAKRFEILSDVDETDFSKDLSGGNRPFGDKGSDISELLQGDIHIRGKRRIVIKAGSEIRLEVGRSSIIISDAGIIITSRKTHSDINNSLDSILSVLPINGITIKAAHIQMAAAYDWFILERMGARIEGTAGIMRLSGKDIKASTVTGASYIANFAAMTAAFAANLTSMSIGIHDSDNVQSSALYSYAGVGATALGIGGNAVLGIVKPVTSDSDPDSKIVKFASIFLQQVPTVLGIIQSTLFAPDDKEALDALALAGVIAEWGLIVAIFAAICAASAMDSLFFNDSVHLGNGGDLTFVGNTITAFSKKQAIANSALAGVNTAPKEEDEKSWYDKVKEFIKANKLWFGIGGLGALGALGGVGAAGYEAYSQYNSLGEQAKDLLNELNTL
jgi:hypothetical protein